MKKKKKKNLKTGGRLSTNARKTSGEKKILNLITLPKN